MFLVSDSSYSTMSIVGVASLPEVPLCENEPTKRDDEDWKHSMTNGLYTS